MGKKGEQGATSAGDASINPAASVDAATEIVAQMTEPMPEGDAARKKAEPPIKVRGLEQPPADDKVRKAIRNPREDAMNAIVRSRVEQLAEDAGLDPSELLDADPDTDPADAEAERERDRLAREGGKAEPEAKVEPSQTQQQLEGDVIDDPSRFKVRLKVDGQEMLVPLSDIVRPAQKEAAANKRLEEATRLLADARAAAAKEPAPAAAPAPAPQPTDVGPKIQEFVAATYSGDEERLAKATRELLGTQAVVVPATPATPALDEAALSAVVEKQLRKKAVTSALSKFRSENEGIVKDPYLAIVADQILASETQGVPLEELPEERVNEALIETAKKTREWAAKAGVSVTPKTESTTRRERAERKTEIDELPSINASSATNAERPQSPQEIMAEMRKARGLPVH